MSNTLKNLLASKSFVAGCITSTGSAHAERSLSLTLQVPNWMLNFVSTSERLRGEGHEVVRYCKVSDWTNINGSDVTVSASFTLFWIFNQLRASESMRLVNAALKVQYVHW